MLKRSARYVVRFSVPVRHVLSVIFPKYKESKDTFSCTKVRRIMMLVRMNVYMRKRARSYVVNDEIEFSYSNT